MWQKRSKGMTLIELLVAMAMLIILIAVGMPSYVTLRQSQAQSASMQHTYGLLQFARSLAMTDATLVTFCASTNQSSCSDAGNFADGAIVLAQNADGENELVRVMDASSVDDMSITLDGFADANKIEFNDTGEVVSLAGNASIIFCDPRGSDMGEALIMNPLGMVRMGTDDDGDSVINIHDQSNVTCD